MQRVANDLSSKCCRLSHWLSLLPLLLLLLLTMHAFNMRRQIVKSHSSHNVIYWIHFVRFISMSFWIPVATEMFKLCNTMRSHRSCAVRFPRDSSHTIMSIILQMTTWQQCRRAPSTHFLLLKNECPLTVSNVQKRLAVGCAFIRTSHVLHSLYSVNRRILPFIHIHLWKCYSLRCLTGSGAGAGSVLR